MFNQFLTVVWHFNPTFIRIGSLDIRWYGVMWAIAIGLGAFFFVQFCKREGLPAKLADSIFIYGALATIIGARLGHCLFYEPGYYLANPLKLLAFRDGGMASHGAAIGLLIGLWLFSRKNRMPYLWSLDRVMIPVAVGGAFVRMGNLFNHEIYGHPTDRPWGFRFIENVNAWMNGAEPVYGPPSHPTQIYEALAYLVLFALLCYLYYRKDAGRRYPGLLFGVGLIGIFLSRFLIEYVKNDQVDFEATMFLNMGQWLSVPFIIAGIVMIVYALHHKQTPPPLAEVQALAAKRDAQTTARNAKNNGKRKKTGGRRGAPSRRHCGSFRTELPPLRGKGPSDAAFPTLKPYRYERHRKNDIRHARGRPGYQPAGNRSALRRAETGGVHLRKIAPTAIQPDSVLAGGESGISFRRHAGGV